MNNLAWHNQRDYLGPNPVTAKLGGGGDVLPKTSVGFASRVGVRAMCVHRRAQDVQNQ